MRIRTALAALALPLVLAACGDDADTTASDPGTGVSSAGATTSPSPAASSEAPSATPSEPVPTPTPTPSGPSGPSGAPTSDPTLPACADVWVQDARLRSAYTGCDQGGTSVPADVLSCSSGQSLVRYDDRFWAVLGGDIHRTKTLDQDDGYLEAIASCRG